MQTPKILICGNIPMVMRAFINQLESTHSLLRISCNPNATVLPANTLLTSGLIFANAAVSDALPCLKYLKQRFPNIPFALLSAQPSHRDGVEAVKAGANEFFAFPKEQDKVLDFLNLYYRVAPRKPIVDNSSKWNWKKLFSWIEQIGRAEPIGIVAQGVTSKTNNNEVATLKADLCARFFGKFEVTFRNQPIKVQGAKAKSILAYLIFHHHRSIHKDALMAKFWPDSAPSSARNNLNVHMHNIRKALQAVDQGRDCIILKNECYSFCESLRIETDVDHFMRHWHEGNEEEQSRLEEAAFYAYHKAFAFYRGSFLEEMPYDEWTDMEREKLREIYLIMLDRLSQFCFESGRFEAAINLGKKILELDSCMENIHRRIIRSYHKLGRRDQAIRQYKKCIKALDEELGVPPSEMTTQLLAQVSN